MEKQPINIEIVKKPEIEREPVAERIGKMTELKIGKHGGGDANPLKRNQ